MNCYICNLQLKEDNLSYSSILRNGFYCCKCNIVYFIESNQSMIHNHPHTIIIDQYEFLLNIKQIFFKKIYDFPEFLNKDIYYDSNTSTKKEAVEFIKNIYKYVNNLIFE